MRNQFGETLNPNTEPALPAREVATLLAKAIFEVEANLEEAKWFAGNKQWILASVHITRASHLLKSAQKIHEQAHGVPEN